MLKSKKRLNITIVSAISILILLLAMVLGIFMQTPNIEAAQLKVGELNYVGSSNKCYYDIVFNATAIIGNAYGNDKYSYDDFVIFLEGVSCTRSILTTFNYVFTTLQLKMKQTDENYTVISDKANPSTKPFSFKVIDKDQVTTGDLSYILLFYRHDLNGSGDYKLVMNGEIRSNVTAKFNIEYDFTII